VEINIGGLQLAGSTLSQRRAASGVDSIEALMALRRRTLSFPAPGAPGGLGEVGGVVSLQDFNLIKVLGKGRFGPRCSLTVPSSLLRAHQPAFPFSHQHTASERCSWCGR